MAGSVGRSVALRSETGSGTVLMTGIISALLIMALAISALIGAQAAVGKARGAADLAALGGATALTSVSAPSGVAGASGNSLAP